ncbi:MAG: Spy/CpxP family protein refolding chaperone [Alphaproteobacteria bacterium]
MRNKLPWILLAVSVVANIFFAGGAIYTLSARSGNAVKQVIRELDLTPAQRDGLLALREGVAVRRAAMTGMRGGLRKAMLAEIGNPTFDRERVTVLVGEWSDQRRAYFVDLAENLHAYVATLTPEQRETFLTMAQERGFLRRLLRRKR